jgi:glutamyl-tRNA reductase
MKVQVVGLSHHSASIAVRERLAFSTEQTCSALDRLRAEFPEVESVLLSTCNRVELYIATEAASVPTLRQVAEFFARFHDLDASHLEKHLYERTGEAAVRHLFTVASSLADPLAGEAGLPVGHAAPEHRPAHARRVPGRLEGRPARGR